MNDETVTPLVDDEPNQAPTPEVSEKTDNTSSTKDWNDYQQFLQWRQQQGKTTTTEDEDPEVYVHLANGETRRVKTSEVPNPGTGGFGHFEEDNKVHQIIGVYPVEIER